MEQRAVRLHVLLTPRSHQNGPNTVADDITINDNLLKNANYNLVLLRSSSSAASYHSLGFSLGHRCEATD